MSADLHIANHGSILILTATTVAGQEWLDENVGDDETQTWGDGIVVEPRYIGNIIDGAVDAGLEVA